MNIQISSETTPLHYRGWDINHPEYTQLLTLPEDGRHGLIPACVNPTYTQVSPSLRPLPAGIAALRWSYHHPKPFFTHQTHSSKESTLSVLSHFIGFRSSHHPAVTIWLQLTAKCETYMCRHCSQEEEPVEYLR